MILYLESYKVRRYILACIILCSIILISNWKMDMNFASTFLQKSNEESYKSSVLHVENLKEEEIDKHKEEKLIPVEVIKPHTTTTTTTTTTTKSPEPKKPSAAEGGFEISIDNPMTGGNFWMDGKLCAGIENLVGSSTVADFGAGLGQYGRCLTRNTQNLINSSKENYKSFHDHLLSRMIAVNLQNKTQVIKSWKGYDGASNIENITNGWVKYFDLTKASDLGQKFDWVISLEVGEHIPNKFEDIYIDNLVKHTGKGMILSWAVVGQGGHNHINTHNNDYVINKMKTKGFIYDAQNATVLRQNIIQGYFANTIMVFRRP